MSNERNKRIVSILMTLTIIFTLIGGTLSYLRWQTTEEQKTLVTFTIESEFSCAADGGGDIASSTLMPATCTNPNYAIQREITVMPTIFGELNIYMNLWLDINELGSGLSQSEHFKYALTTEENSCTTGIVSEGRFTGLSAENKDKVMLLNEQEYTSSEPQTYYLYIWIDPLEENNYIVNQPFNFSLGGSCTSVVENSTYTEPILKGTDPELESGMIPVTISDTGAVTVADISQEWYKYEDKEWANAVLVNSTSRSTYINQDGTFNANTPIPEDNILAYYVWIPRYKYTFPKADGNPESISIIFENNETDKSIPTSGKASGTDYYTHPAFTFGTDNELNGIWVGKFETSHSTLKSDSSSDDNNLACTTIDCANANGLIIKPNVISLRRNSLSRMFYASRSMTRTSNPFGLTTSTDSHMMKNGEWGAVAYLSHSIYGKNAEVGINSNRSFTTGAGDGTTYGTPTNGDYIYPQSTTGNITGVFDMSGGANEYVMGNHNSDTDNHLLDSKYYDKYTVTSMSSCTLQECGGHALYETAGWYSDINKFVDQFYVKFLRGGFYSSGVNAGAFNSNNGIGDAVNYNSFRAVLVKGV